MKIGILNIGTGNYRHYFPSLYYTIKKYFLPDHEKHFFFFCDFPEKYPDDVSFLHIERKGFPGDTLLRYHYFSMAEKYIVESGVDVLYYLDVDMLINDFIGDEVLPTKSQPLIATAHPGFYNNYTPTAPLGTPETRVSSTAYVDGREPRPCYWAGGFNGGTTEEFLKMSRKIRENIDTDLQKDIIAIWHDESHLNRYLISNQQLTKTLLPSYCYPESWNLPYPKKILALDKDHEAIRK
jgi:histo-blood group ABO system transferase